MSSDPATLGALALAATFVLGVLFGAIVQRTHFCTMGGIADAVNFGDWTRLRQWLLAIAVAVAGTTLLDVAGVIDVRASYYTTPRLTPLAYAVGGLLFGFGMVLAGGCGMKSLVRAGGGSLKALVVLLVMAVVAYITLRGALALVRVGALERVGTTLAVRQDLPSLIAVGDAERTAWQLTLGLALALLLSAFALRERTFRTATNLLAGVGIGLIVVGAWWVSGALAFVPEHPQTLEAAFLRTNSRQMESLSFVAPLAWTLDYLMFASDRSKEITLGIAAVAGMLAGGAAGALASGEFRWEGFGDAADTGRHLVGGALMGFGGVTALGCTIGQGLSGLSTLALGSFIAVAGIVVGGVAGVRYLAWSVARSDRA